MSAANLVIPRSQGRKEEVVDERSTQGDEIDGKSSRRNSHTRYDPRAVGADLHANFGLVRRRRDQGRAAGPRRHHARPVARQAQCRQPLFHHAQLQQAQHHAQYQERKGQRGFSQADQGLRRDGGELRSRSARPPGIYLGSHSRTQSALDLRFGQRFRPRSLRRLQSL